MLITVATTTLSLFQTAMLETLSQHLIWVDDRIGEWSMRTYMRRTINDEDESKARRLKA